MRYVIIFVAATFLITCEARCNEQNEASAQKDAADRLALLCKHTETLAMEARELKEKGQLQETRARLAALVYLRTSLIGNAMVYANVDPLVLKS